ncbi:MAG: hypothetical protein QME70_04090 [Bacillota bacterium]|nr:hypothetical protein [Bacillota bacterium]
MESLEAIVERAVKMARNYSERLQPAIVQSLIQLGASSGLPIQEAPIQDENASSDARVEKLAEALDCTVDEIRRLFHFTTEGFVLYGYKEAGTKTESVRELCGLYMVANEVINRKPRSSADELVGLLKKYNLYDRGNFAGYHMGKSKWFIADDIEGQRYYELTFPGRQALKEVVRRVTAETG